MRSRTGGHDGREVDGLGTMTQLKGARSVLASLWEVDDENTAGLMREFYSRWLQPAGKLDKAEALRDAQLHLLNPSGGQASGDSGRAASLCTHPHYCHRPRPFSSGTHRSAGPTRSVPCRLRLWLSALGRTAARTARFASAGIAARHAHR